jgi:predicted MFS family arabinose efflux permease
LAAFAVLESSSERPLLRVERLTDRAVGGGFLLMLTASAVLFGTFLLSSMYLQRVLGTGALETGLMFLPLALATAVGAHVGSHVIGKAGVRVPMAGGFVVSAGGTLLLAGVEAGGSYVADVLPGIVVSGVGLGVVLVAVGVSILTGARDEETGMLSGLNTTGHEIGGALGIAVLITIASASGIADAFLAAAALSIAGAVVALLVLPPARTFLPKLRLAPSSMPIH